MSKHNDRDQTGRYKNTHACDGCTLPVGADHMTDEEVCGGSDGPGWYICHRRRCAAKLDGLSVEQRREVYTKNREVV